MDEQDDGLAAFDGGVAGRSAETEAARLRQRDHQRIVECHPRVGKRLDSLRGDSLSVQRWKKGAVGERRVGARLDKLAGRDILVLHDRRVPGTRANIDHIAIAPSGVWIIDTKNHKGRIERRDVGKFFQSDVRLYVGGRDRTQLVEGVRTAGARVAAVIGRTEVPMMGALCFTMGDWAFPARPFVIDGASVTWPRALNRALRRRGPLDQPTRFELARHLAVELPPAA